MEKIEVLNYLCLGVVVAIAVYFIQNPVFKKSQNKLVYYIIAVLLCSVLSGLINGIFHNENFLEYFGKGVLGLVAISAYLAIMWHYVRFAFDKVNVRLNNVLASVLLVAIYDVLYIGPILLGIILMI